MNNELYTQVGKLEIQRARKGRRDHSERPAKKFLCDAACTTGGHSPTVLILSVIAPEAKLKALRAELNDDDNVLEISVKAPGVAGDDGALRGGLDVYGGARHADG